jgi:AcrR family transcriptional regulator
VAGRAGRRAARRRRSAADRRAEVIAAARALMARNGAAAVSMRAIAAAAGVSPAALYLYFPEKLRLMAAVVDAVFEGLLAAFREAVAAASASPDPFARLAALMDAYVAWGLAHPDEYRLVFMTPVVGVAGHRPGAPDGRPLSPNGVATFAALAAELARLIELGEVVAADPAMLAEQIWAGGHGLVSLMITFPEFEWSPRAALCAALRATLLRGIRARSG